MIVIDASVAVKWVIEVPDRSHAIELVRSGIDLIAPSILVPEVTNVLRKKAKRDEIGWDQVTVGLVLITGTIKRLVDISPWGPRIVALSRDLDHPAYDCCYLACAETHGAAFVTSDRTLAAKARQAGVNGSELAQWRAVIPH